MTTTIATTTIGNIRVVWYETKFTDRTATYQVGEFNSRDVFTEIARVTRWSSAQAAYWRRLRDHFQELRDFTP